jgi:alpha-beta hydrolase superfamily lysophospholipase
MNILFLHGTGSKPGDVRASYLIKHGHDVSNPALPDDDFDEAVRIAQAEYDHGRPEVVVGSSRGGAVAMNIESGATPLVLLCPAWKRYGTVTNTKPNTTILHSKADERVPFSESEELIQSSGLPLSALIDVGREHRLTDEESLAAMLRAVEDSVGHSRK